MSFLLGLTGSIGMGKSTTAQMFVDEGCALWDADAAVHRLYAKGGAAVGPLSSEFPNVIENGAVLRAKLRDVIQQHPKALARIEQIAHPLVAGDRAAFIDQQTAQVIVLDIPLLFETGGHAAMDAVAVVYVSDDVQEQRVMARGTMTRDQFLAIKAKQMPADEKRELADYVIETDDMDTARAQVRYVMADIRNRIDHA
ncbi:dephospho-CoA kinase [uncultured Tateyamaria sp.]|uniref:dephospho-CoA kinase n=1 Tax=uncultured Tateyamaria sp. TaxID=455651 RepID=UPI00262F1E62|nr:dephospho-CoA kinase [uncultured Tateyamaria sp.]